MLGLYRTRWRASSEAQHSLLLFSCSDTYTVSETAAVRLHVLSFSAVQLALAMATMEVSYYCLRWQRCTRCALHVQEAE